MKEDTPDIGRMWDDCFQGKQGDFPSGVQFRWGSRLFSLFNGEVP